MLGVSRSRFHAWQRRAPSDRELADAWLVERIREIHTESRATYGARRVHRALRHRGVRVGRKHVERLMRRERLSGLVPKRYRRTTICVPGVRVADDLVERHFVPAAPNRLWCADIKYVRTWQGWLDLAAVMDCYSRRIVGWSMRPDLEAELIVDALEMAIARRRPSVGLVHHSDQGSQYVSLRFGERSREIGIHRSMGSKGDCFDRRRRRELLHLLRRRSFGPARGEDGGLRLHRDVLQPGQAALDARLPVAGRVREDNRERNRESRLIKTVSTKPGAVRGYRAPGICDRLPPVATTGLHKGAILRCQA
jgi:putative transposase